MPSSHHIVVVGGGVAGLAIASKLRRTAGRTPIAFVSSRFDELNKEIYGEGAMSLLAQSGHFATEFQSAFGVKQTLIGRAPISAFDPNGTSTGRCETSATRASKFAVTHTPPGRVGARPGHPIRGHSGRLSATSRSAGVNGTKRRQMGYGVGIHWHNARTRNLHYFDFVELIVRSIQLSF
jgi:hypothetical protein